MKQYGTALMLPYIKGGGGITRNTAFNGNYVFNLLAGYERKPGKKTYLTVDVKDVLAGGTYPSMWKRRSAIRIRAKCTKHTSRDSIPCAFFYRIQF